MAAGALFEYVLRLGDNCLILSQRLSELCGHGPVLEEDIAIANIALDLLGHARFWLSYAGEIEGEGRDEDKLAFLRDAGDFRNVLLVEQPNGDYAMTVARQFFFDAWYFHILRGLKNSVDARVASIAEKAFKEVTYHLERSTDWMLRMGDGTEESHRRMQAAVNDLWMYTGELFEMDEVDREMVELGGGVDLANLHPLWTEHIARTFAEATLEIPESKWMQRGGKRGVHTEKLGYLLAEMQFLQRAYPGAQW
ncbi:MAG TPA: 1,2-phenylacetyl-CoA epoxidase subunit PaaC [Bryobacteraceae bacterium]|nr:1,2-phenylacetyl-CoA epoxidase subunit PaaC [Bryobacteraceae bacterium]